MTAPVREQLQRIDPSVEATSGGPSVLESLAGYRSDPDAALPALDRLAEHLERMGPATSAEDGRALIEALAQGRFDGQSDGRGRALKLLGIEALLRLGYPRALEIDPGDLQWYRAQRQRRSRKLLLAALALAAAVGAGAGLLSLWLSSWT
jgi:hypothetical protein